MNIDLQIGDDLALPLDAITQTFGILAVRGAGKSNLAAVMAEQMHGAALPFVVIDPVGSWYGLRSSRDGTGAGLPIPIFGGRHGDLPLERTAGQEVADLVVDERVTSVLDLSEFSEGDKIKFLTDFAERLYRRNEAPLHLFLEEADDYIPQRPFREQARLLRAWENIVRRGRARGLGMTMITQRSAAINKSVLTQIETLFVLRTTSPNDRKAIEGWVDYHGERKDVLATLPTLASGEAWVWSPTWLQKFARVRIHRRATYDSGATPKTSKAARKPATLADIDLGAVRQRFAATIERAKADDPKELRGQIAALKRDLSAAQKAAPAPVDPVKVPVLEGEQLRRAEAIVERVEQAIGAHRTVMAGLGHQIRTEIDGMEKKISGLGSEVVDLRAAIDRATTPQRVTQPGARRSTASAATLPRANSAAPEPPQRRASVPSAARASEGSSGLTGPEQRIIDAIAWLESIGVAEPEQTAVAFLARYTYGGGAFNNPRGSLRTKGLVEYAPGERIQLTDEGRAAAHAPDAPLSPEDLHQRVLDRLPGPEQRLLTPLLRAYPQAMSNEKLAEAAG